MTIEPRSAASRRRLAARRLALGLTMAFAWATAPAQPVPPTAPQTPPAQPAAPQRPTFRTEANLVRVDVFVTIGGRAVTDLRREEFRIFEDGVPQTIESFEHVVVARGAAGAARVEPNTVGEALAMAADPRSRVFVLFLDTGHVSVFGSHRIGRPLIRLVERVLAPSDLVGVMTPQMPASALTLARKMEVVAGGLLERWDWGDRGSLIVRDPREQAYEQCYPPGPYEGPRSALAQALIERRREQASLEALRDLVGYLAGVRDERKVVIPVTDGWTLFREDPALLAATPPVPPAVHVSPRGTLTTRDERSGTGGLLAACEADRVALAYIDHERDFRTLLEDAARSNVSFYPVDPRGLVAFDTEIGPERPLAPPADAAQLRRRHDALRTLAAATGGLAVLDSNDLDAGLARVADDLTSYYLLTYYSTNAAADGRYRRIDARVTRPGVLVRARRGYQAPSAAELARARAPSLSSTPALEAEAARSAAVDREIAALATLRSRRPLELRVVTTGGSRPAVWVAMELAAPSSQDAPEWAAALAAGFDVALQVRAERAGPIIGTATRHMDRTRRAVLARIALDAPELRGPDGPGAGQPALGVDARIQSAAGASLRSLDVRASVAPVRPGTARQASAALLFRQGPGAAGEAAPVAVPEFRRGERLRAELWVDGPVAATEALLLDRQGGVVAVPVTTAERQDAETGERWVVAEVSLAPLAPGDYVLAVRTAGPEAREEVLTGFRVVR